MLPMKKALWTGAALVVVALCVVAGVWWKATAENNRLGPPAARRYAMAVHISGFTRHVQYRAETGSVVVFLGPATTAFQPGLVTGPTMKLWQPDPATNADDTEDHVLEGTVGGSDGPECDMGISRYRPGAYVSEDYELSPDQAEQAKSGVLQVLTLEVHCGGK